MPRKPRTILPLAPKRAVIAFVTAVADSPQWLWARRPWQLACDLFDQHRVLRWVEGDFSPLVQSARLALVEQLNVTANLLYRDPRVQQRCGSASDVRVLLAGYLEWSIGGHPNQPYVVVAPAGNTLGSQREYARMLEPGKSFAEMVRKARGELGEHATHTEIWSHLGMSEATYYRYLAKERRRKNKVRGARGEACG
jgi:hypothetical protein